MVIEIGTSDFDTLAGVEYGIYIEPVKYYFDRLPDNIIKENVAISNYCGECTIYYVDDEIIKRYNAPDWLRGCSSINTKHIRLLKYIPKNEILEMTVKVDRIKNIIKNHNVEKIDFLKIDTEGHDTIILNDFLDTIEIKPSKIQFENNILSDKNEVNKLIYRLEDTGYKIIKTLNDVIAQK